MRRHQAHRKERAPRRAAGASNSCGVVAYQDRSHAETAARKVPCYRGQRLRPYECKTEFGGCGMFHIGYIPELVIAGVCTSTEWYESYAGGKPLRVVLPPLMDYLTRHVKVTAPPQITRRVHPVTDEDLWTLIVETDRGTHQANDLPTPAEAVVLVLTRYRASRARRTTQETPA